MSLQEVTKGQKPAAEFKGSVFTFTVLLIRRFDLAEIAADVEARLAQAPRFFLNAPVVLDLSPVAEEANAELAALADVLRRAKLMPVGVCNGSASQHEAAVAAGLAVVQHSTRRAPAPVEPRAVAAEAAPATAEIAAAAARGTRVITQPVRSGQQIYARGDLIVLAAVNPGAEVIADGHIHVYAPLRGRALAGVKGNGDARIFTLNFGPEMVAIAGIYRVFEDAPLAQPQGTPTQVALDGEKLLITALT